MAKDKMSHRTDRRKTKCRKYKTVKDPKQGKQIWLYVLYYVYENHLFQTTRQLK
jgi:hypothetical protein